MKTTLLFVITMFFFSLSNAQSLEGAWKLTHQDGKKVRDKEYIKIYQDGYFAFGAKELKDNHFIGAGGGRFAQNGDTYIETLDFLTLDSNQVGATHKYILDWANEKMVISATINGKMLVEIWEKISDKKDDLTQTWVFTGRKRDGELSRSTPGARRTVKILTGGRFQWIAFNSETKEFMGTGGGTYTAKNGKYTEEITFFSRDDSRVGATLEFNYEIIDGEWHHTGFSSKGDPMYEIWTPYAIGYKGK